MTNLNTLIEETVAPSSVKREFRAAVEYTALVYRLQVDLEGQRAAYRAGFERCFADRRSKGRISNPNLAATRRAGL
jgi:hypothetical protein